MYLNEILIGDCLEKMKSIPDGIIDLTVTSPPYDNLRTYNGKITDEKFNGFTFKFEEIANELYRITKNGGIVVWIVNDQVIDGGESGNSFRQVLQFQEIGFKIYDTMIYHKNGSAYHESGRYDQVFEYMFVLLKGKRPNTVNLIKDKVNKWAGSKTFGTPSTRQKDGSLKKMKEGFTVSEYGTRYNVWYVVNGYGFGNDKEAIKHPASFPYALAEDHILSWSNENDIVFDPMCGSGTTCIAAKMNNRKYIGIDINDDYVTLSKSRLEKVLPFNCNNINPKNKFIISREEILSQRKLKKSKE